MDRVDATERNYCVILFIDFSLNAWSVASFPWRPAGLILEEDAFGVGPLVLPLPQIQTLLIILDDGSPACLHERPGGASHAKQNQHDQGFSIVSTSLSTTVMILMMRRRGGGWGLFINF